MPWGVAIQLPRCSEKLLVNQIFNGTLLFLNTNTNLVDFCLSSC